MYEVDIYNGDVKTVIHYPSADAEAPHLLSLPFKESLSMSEELSFLIPFSNPGYNLINGLKTRVKVIDTRDNSIIFSGRVIPLKSNMNNGAFNKEVTCEGALSYLNDTNTRRWNFTNQTPTQILTYLLAQHNAKVDSSKQINLGVVEVTQPITLDTNYETSLNAIISKLRNILGGDIRVQERNNIFYLDYLIDQGANNNVELRLGYNLKDLIVEYDPLDIVTRVIPLGYGEGINQLDIKKVNGGIEYIEDAPSISEYGVIEGVVTNLDIQNADTLKIYGKTVLDEKKQIKLVYGISQLDVSVLAGHEFETYDLGDTLYTLCDVMNIDVYARVVERDRDLILNPWNPTLAISTRPITLSDQIINLKLRNQSLENAPQGNTCIFPINIAENSDATHPITFDLDIPKETININKVYINLHGRKYRANSKDSESGGGIVSTTASGGGETASSNTKAFIAVNLTSGVPTNSIGTENWGYHLHSTMISGDLFEHSHTVPIKAHIHDIAIAAHVHKAIYGIFEDAYPKNTKIKVNDVDIGINLGDGASAFDQYNIDITSKVNIGNNKIEISTEQNGRIEAIIYSQIFIQSK